jgi:hypothetical protein
MDTILANNRRKSTTKLKWPAPADEHKERMSHWTFWIVFLIAMVGSVVWKITIANVSP